MDGREARAPIRPAQALPPLPQQGELAAHESLRGRRPESDDELRRRDGGLSIEPPSAPLHLITVRLLVKALFPTRLEFEMLDGVRDISRSALDSRFGESLVENTPRGPDEGAPGTV